MRKKDFRLILRYLGRFFEEPLFTRQKLSAALRYFMCGCSVLVEKLRGLDFTMVYNSKEEHRHNSVYTKAPKRVLKKIFKNLPYDKKLSVVDVGCGKGYVVKEAYKYPFCKVGGLEYSDVLYNICVRNLKKLNLNDTEIANCDARSFENYKDFNIFFMNNPFDETILSDVAKKIYDSHPNGGILLFYLNPVPERHQAIIKEGFELKEQINDSYESYFLTNVYRIPKIK